MATGQVSFHRDKLVGFIPLSLPSLFRTHFNSPVPANPMKVKRINVPQRENPIVNRLNKTKVEKYPDLKAEKDDFQRQARRKDQAAQKERQKEEQRVAKERKELAWQRDHAYDDLMNEEAMEASNNQNRNADWEEDFM